MASENRESWGWRVAALLLWMLFFGVALFPDYCYSQLRVEGNVATQHALTNSVHLIYISQVVYFFLFVVRAARSAGLNMALAQVLAVQLAIVSLIAFIPAAQPERIPEYFAIPDPKSRWLILSVCALKIASWLYLFSLVFRFHLDAGTDIFRQMVPVFPSGREGDGPASPPDNPS